jgi:thioredoxin reductase/ferredoxin
VARAVARDPGLRAGTERDGILDLAILGAGVSGLAAAVEARRLGLSFTVLESAAPLSTLASFPPGKPIYTYPSDWNPAGALQVKAVVKEELIRELETQLGQHAIAPTPGHAVRVERRGGMFRIHLREGAPLFARRVLVAIGRTGSYRRLGVPGEDGGQILHRLHDPADYRGRQALVIGGGDTAVETAIALVLAGASVTLVHRGPGFPRVKPENAARLERLRRDPAAPVTLERSSDAHAAPAFAAFLEDDPRGTLDVRLGTRVEAIRPGGATIAGDGSRADVRADVVFAMIGRDPPLDLLRASGVRIAQDWTLGRGLGLAAFLAFAAALYDWKSGGFLDALFRARGWFSYDLGARLAALGDGVSAAASDPRTLLGTLAISAAGPAFWYTLAYSTLVVGFGIRRIRRRRTPYVTAQTVTLMLVQVLPLFLLPELVLPWLEHHHWLPAGVADPLFPPVDHGHGREFWRAYGLVLAWPLNVYNVFTPEPLPAWIAISVAQTLVLIPLAIYFFGKGAYCGWICSCGALAETLGDTHRHKMPHGPGWNRLNLAGQAILGVAVVLLIVRIAGWAMPEGNLVDRTFDRWLKEGYKWTVDVFLAGVIGYGLYFWFSGRTWCRFFCPLAALMHVYARFSSFRILSDKKKCISCNRCTAVCHQGIDVMSFAHQGVPMADPQCVRCSACVQSCPTGVLSFGRVDRRGGLIGIDALAASPVRSREDAGPRPR